MGRPKKEKKVKENEVYYAASLEPIEPEMEIFPELTADAALDYLKENEPNMKEVFLYEIKLVGKYKVSYNLEKVK